MFISNLRYFPSECLMFINQCVGALGLSLALMCRVQYDRGQPNRLKLWVPETVYKSLQKLQLFVRVPAGCFGPCKVQFYPSCIVFLMHLLLSILSTLFF